MAKKKVAKKVTSKRADLSAMQKPIVSSVILDFDQELERMSKEDLIQVVRFFSDGKYAPLVKDRMINMFEEKQKALWKEFHLARSLFTKEVFKHRWWKGDMEKFLARKGLPQKFFNMLHDMNEKFKKAVRLEKRYGIDPTFKDE